MTAIDMQCHLEKFALKFASILDVWIQLTLQYELVPLNATLQPLDQP
jgi:hypothetical protein